MSSRARQAVGSLLSISLVLALGATARSDGPSARLKGPALAGPTHLHLIAAGAPPFIFDVDANVVREVAGVVDSADATVSVSRSGKDALAVIHGTPSTAVRIRLDGSIRRLGTARNIVAAHDSSALWMLRGSAGHCRLQLVPSSRSAVRAPCSFVGEDTPAGLHTWTQNREFLLDGRTGRIRAQNAVGWGLGGVARNLVLERYGDPVLGYRQLRLVDLASGQRRPLGWPSTLGWLDDILPQPHGTLVAVSFADPSIQASDVWILDTATGKFWHLPGFPASISLKFSSMAWTSDDRLVLLVERDDRTRLAVWTPGSKRLPQREVKLPPPSGGSDAFVPLVGP